MYSNSDVMSVVIKRTALGLHGCSGGQYQVLTVRLRGDEVAKTGSCQFLAVVTCVMLFCCQIDARSYGLVCMQQSSGPQSTRFPDLVRVGVCGRAVSQTQTWEVSVSGFCPQIP